ncbi:MAG: acyltransferase family protein [Candidatus Gastranaerophilaceae bacterium]
MFHCSRNKMVDFNTFAHLNVCVDYFFIMAGFFLFHKINTAQTTFEFAQKRFFRLALLLWLFIIFSFIMSLVIGTPFSFDGQILRIFLLHNIGFGPATGGIGALITWFISALFWVSIFYFYISKILQKKYLNLVIWIITVCSLGMLFNYSGFETGGNTNNIYYFINTGIIRGLGGMGIGYFINELFKNNFLQNKSKTDTIIYSGIEIFCIGFLSYYMLFITKLPGKTGFLYLFIFSILFYMFLIKKGIISRFLDNKISEISGKYSYAIYVMHPLVMAVFNKKIYLETNTFVTSHIPEIFTVEIIVAVILGMITHYLFEKPINNFIRRKFN